MNIDLIFRMIEDRRRDKKISKSEFYELIGISQPGYRKMVENVDMKLSTLSKIADVLEMPINAFFEVADMEDVVRDHLDQLQKDYDFLAAEFLGYKDKYISAVEKYNKCLEEKEVLQSQKTVPVVPSVQKLKGIE